MRIALGSKSDKKYRALVDALNELNLDYIVDTYKVESNVSDNPINEETLMGARNRNSNLINIDNTYDMYVSIEAGFTKENDNYYVDTYCVINYDNNDYIGRSSRLRITKTVFNYVSAGNVLHLLVQKLQDSTTDDGVIGYLSNGKVKRSEVEKECVLEALKEALKIKYDYKKINIDDCLDENRIKKLDLAIENERI